MDNEKRLYVLPLQWKTWSLDKDGAIRIKRCGFPLVPDFGGTGCSWIVPRDVDMLIKVWKNCFIFQSFLKMAEAS